MGLQNQPNGMHGMLKEEHKHLSGLDEAVLKNIDACKQLSSITRTSLGPNGMNKMAINHLDKLFVTSDTGTIVNELEIQHPADKLLVQLAEKHNRRKLAMERTLYTKASNKDVEILEGLAEPGSETMHVRNKDGSYFKDESS